MRTSSPGTRPTDDSVPAANYSRPRATLPTSPALGVTSVTPNAADQVKQAMRNSVAVATSSVPDSHIAAGTSPEIIPSSSPRESPLKIRPPQAITRHTNIRSRVIPE